MRSKAFFAIPFIASALVLTVPQVSMAGADPSLDGQRKINVHARYPGDNVHAGKYHDKHFVERCNWFIKGSFWGGDRPLGLTQGCARIDVPKDMSDHFRN